MLWVWLLSMAACSAVVHNDKKKLGAMPIPCEVGQTAVCPCPDGTPSTQMCNSSARYDPCVCKSVNAERPASVAGAAGAPARAGSGAAAGATGSAGR